MMLKQTILDLINANIRNKLPKVKKSEHAAVEEALLDAIFIPFQVFELDCTQQFIDDNFDLAPGATMGLGKNAMLGFAMCNGNNGTKDRRKKVSVGYDNSAYIDGPDFSIIGNEGGSADAVVVEHSHDFKNTLVGHGSGGVGNFASNRSNIQYSDNAATKSSGVSGKDKNYQPFIVTLVVQRI